MGVRTGTCSWGKPASLHRSPPPWPGAKEEGGLEVMQAPRHHRQRLHHLLRQQTGKPLLRSPKRSPVWCGCRGFGPTPTSASTCSAIVRRKRCSGTRVRKERGKAMVNGRRSVIACSAHKHGRSYGPRMGGPPGGGLGGLRGPLFLGGKGPSRLPRTPWAPSCEGRHPRGHWGETPLRGTNRVLKAQQGRWLAKKEGVASPHTRAKRGFRRASPPPPRVL